MKSFILCVVLTVLSLPAIAQERGAVTNLPLPRFVSLKTSEANARRGPSLTHRIDWIFKRRNMPLEITAEYGHWRRIRDHDGAGGWVHYTLLSGVRTVLVVSPMIEILTAPRDGAMTVAKLEQGVVAKVSECEKDWCKIRVDGNEGWTPKTGLWGVNDDEILE